MEDRRRRDGGRPASGTVPPSRLSALRAVQALAALWLLISPWVSPPNGLVMAKDVTAGAVLLAVMVVTTVHRRSRWIEAPVCFAVGVLLIAALVGMEFGSGQAATAQKWSEVVVGVLLVYVAAERVK